MPHVQVALGPGDARGLSWHLTHGPSLRVASEPDTPEGK